VDGEVEGRGSKFQPPAGRDQDLTSSSVWQRDPEGGCFRPVKNGSAQPLPTLSPAAPFGRDLPLMNSSSESVAKSRVLELDALRALAALSLMLFHFTHVYSVKYGYAPPLGFEFPYGKYGTQLFFMLSGYVNAMTLLGKREPWDFLAARAIRILPSYYLVIAVNLVLLLWLPFTLIGNYSWPQVAAQLTVVPGLLGFEFLEPVTWTLQVEVLFYAALLVMYCSGGLERPLRTLLWYLAICLAGTWWLGGIDAELSGTAAADRAKLLQELLLLPYLPLFAMGMLLYEVRRGAGSRFWNSLGVLAAAVVFHTIDQRDHNPAATILFLGLLAGAGWGVLPPLRCRPLVFVSTISYSLYLLHNNLGTTFIYHLNQAGVPSLVCFLLVIPFVIAISSAATFWFEQPISAFLRRAWKNWRRSRKANQQLQPATYLAESGQ
jgi:peptidoglycan/LPS O-acetylase OafA/YrhL